MNKVDDVVAKLGVTSDELAFVSEKAEAHIQNTLGVARTLSIRGTPTFIYEQRIIQGGLSPKSLAALLNIETQ